MGTNLQSGVVSGGSLQLGLGDTSSLKSYDAKDLLLTGRDHFHEDLRKRSRHLQTLMGEIEKLSRGGQNQAAGATSEWEGLKGDSNSTVDAAEMERLRTEVRLI